MPSPSPSSLLASFQEHYDDLLSFLTRRLRDRHRAADVAQETWIKLAKIDPEAVTVLNDRHFIFKVAGNLAIDALRVDQRQTRNLSGEPPSLQIADPGLPPEGLLLATERLSQPGDLGQAAGDQRGARVEPESESVADAGGDGHDVLDGATDLCAGKIVVGIDAQTRTV